VRFMGPMGYVVTFRQTDPLYVLDLADPERPRVRGELKIPGYSAYLHPVGEGLLLGVGQDATATGQVTGSQASLFDVSDPARPARLDTLDLGDWSEAEQDHHAFLWWGRAGLALVPAVADGEALMRGVRVGGRALRPAGAVRHPGGGVVRRSVVRGERVFTVSDGGVATSDLGTLRPVGWTPFTG
ncbi:MAG: beta-propeller domain-containing protein, partial [Thermoleophilia bacterium]|nr:beta-propeller domain-containing protein [Thermoleophilia bacterium]